jgi:hypothetical protein
VRIFVENFGDLRAGKESVRGGSVAIGEPIKV